MNYEIPLISAIIFIFMITAYYLEKSDVCNIGIKSLAWETSTYILIMLLLILLFTFILLLFGVFRY